MGMEKDITHQRFGRLTALGKAWHIAKGCWIYVCDCGEFVVRESKVVAGTAKRGAACCCSLCQMKIKADNGRRNNRGKGSTTYKHLYDVHRQMMRRCYDQASADFPNYGGRGINVCSAWHEQSGFYQWAGAAGYRRGLTIERRDVNGNYCPDNCEWIPNEQQARNTRKVRRLTFNGIERPLTEWAEILGLRPNTIKTRLRLGWSVNDALTKQVSA